MAKSIILLQKVLQQLTLITELYEGLSRAQGSRLEDQRGTEINFELPDFLKDKENGSLCKPLPGSSRNSYENTTLLSNNLNVTNNPKVNNLRIYSPNKFSSDDSSNHCDSLENTVIENKPSSPVKNCEPPPLPPKPKILPMKPSNWGQNGVLKREVKQTLYLEQPTSSFV